MVFVWGMLTLVVITNVVGLGSATRASSSFPEQSSGVEQVMAWTDARCNGCHNVDPVFSHPVGFRPDRPLPERFPLQNGEMTCLTCHDGSDSELHARARQSHDPLLNAPFDGRAFCMECHENGTGFTGMGHAGAVTMAHLMWPDDHSRRDVHIPMTGKLDIESTSCLECHDGTIAKGVGGGHGGRDLFSRGISQDHPVGVAYRADPDWNGMKNLTNVHALDSRVRLYEGSVGCGSCHSVYSDLRNKLVMSNRRSALCLSCHEG